MFDTEGDDVPTAGCAAVVSPVQWI